MARRNRLIGFNGDLTDRVLSVDVDTWSESSLQKVMDEGGRLLNVEFDKEFTRRLLNSCFDSVHIVQEACRRACRAAKVVATSEQRVAVGDAETVPKLVAEVVDEQAARYRGFLQRFADGFQETDLQMPKWIIFVLLTSTPGDLEKGLRLRTISKTIKAHHPKGNDLNNGNITQILNSCTSLQNKKGIRPLIVDYDAANTSLHIVDKGFLIRLENNATAEILEDLELPKTAE